MLKSLRSSPLRWVALYVTLVPAFATVYASFSARSFHDTNIEFEAAAYHDASGLRSALTAVIPHRITVTSWKSGSGTEFRLNPETVSVPSIRHIPGGRLLIQVTGTDEFRGPNGAGGPGGFKEWVSVALAEQSIAYRPDREAEVGRTAECWCSRPL
jgi:hypothetical protein